MLLLARDVVDQKWSYKTNVQTGVGLFGDNSWTPRPIQEHDAAVCPVVNERPLLFKDLSGETWTFLEFADSNLGRNGNPMVSDV